MTRSLNKDFTMIPEKFSTLPLFSVNELRNHISKIVKTSFTSPIIVRGIIASEPKLYPSFVFFDIRDEQKNISFTLYGYIGNFYNIEKKLKSTGIIEKLGQDVPVMLIAEPIISTQKKVDIRLNIIDVIPEYTTSVIANAKNITLNKLAEEGILELQKKLKLPKLVSNIALISSDQGTSAQDIMSGMGAAASSYNILFKSCRVEGNHAVAEITQAIDYFGRNAKRLDIDLIVIARGGGGSTELSVFDDYELCKAVCLCPIPIITAIGHDRDEHAIELCSHITPIPSTPSGIGAFLKQILAEIKEDLEIVIQEVAESIVQRFMREEVLVKNNLNSILSSIKNVFKIHTMKIKMTLEGIVRDSRRYLDYSQERIEELSKLLDAYDHSSVLKRGYAVVWDEKNKVIKTTKELDKTASIEFIDGKVKVYRKIS